MTDHLIAVTFGKLHFERHVSADKIGSLPLQWWTWARPRLEGAMLNLTEPTRRFVLNTLASSSTKQLEHELTAALVWLASTAERGNVRDFPPRLHYRVSFNGDVPTFELDAT